MFSLPKAQGPKRFSTDERIKPRLLGSVYLLSSKPLKLQPLPNQSAHLPGDPSSPTQSLFQAALPDLLGWEHSFWATTKLQISQRRSYLPLVRMSVLLQLKAISSAQPTGWRTERHQPLLNDEGGKNRHGETSRRHHRKKPKAASIQTGSAYVVTKINSQRCAPGVSHLWGQCTFQAAWMGH